MSNQIDNGSNKPSNKLIKPQTTRSVLDILINAAERNSNKSKRGFRYEEVIKLFAAYVKMLGGTLLYETIYKNLPSCFPSPSSVNKYLKDYGPIIIEGTLRSQELLTYLNDKESPLVVWLSEDATKITPRIQYDPTTNQLVGFVLPLNQNGMPILNSFQARHAKEIESHFQTQKEASTIYVIMAQPIKQGVPPFCLLLFGSDNKFSADDVLKRWAYTKNELEKVKVCILN